MTDDEVVEVDGLIGMADLSELVLDERPDLLWPSFTPARARAGAGPRRRHVRGDPAEGHAAAPPLRDLRPGGAVPRTGGAATPTWWRSSRRSTAPRATRPIVAALCEAAEAGKSVTALVELKARFDEAANIRQSRRLERAGAHVVYGFIELQDPCQDLDRGAPRGRRAGHLHPFRHRQLPPDHRARSTPTCQPVHLRRRARARRDAGVQLPLGLCPARAAGKPRDLAAHAESHA